MTFEKVNQSIQNYIKKTIVQRSDLMDDQYKLQLSDALFCARDTIRNQLFFKAIQAAIQRLKEKKETITVVDAGSGIGLLGAYALSLGAGECFFLEHNPYTLDYSKGVLANLGYEEKSHFIQCDATEYQLPKKYDLLISETITSGFVEEDFLAIIKNLRSFANPNAIIIPESFEITMIQKDKKGIELDRKTIRMNSYSELDDSFKKKFLSDANSITYKAKACLFDSVFVESGECMSFLNERTVAINK